MNCSWPSMETALVEKLHRTYMLAAMWKKEKWLKVERSIGAQSCSVGGERREKELTTTNKQETLTNTLTGGRVGREVSKHGALQSWNPPTAEHQSVSSNDPWEEKVSSS